MCLFVPSCLTCQNPLFHDFQWTCLILIWSGFCSNVVAVVIYVTCAMATLKRKKHRSMLCYEHSQMWVSVILLRLLSWRIMADSVLLVTHSSSLPIPSGTAPWHRCRGSMFRLTKGMTSSHASATAPAGGQRTALTARWITTCKPATFESAFTRSIVLN